MSDVRPGEGREAVGGYSRRAVDAGALRLDLNEAPREAGEPLRARLLELLASSPWRRYPDMEGRGAREAAARLYGWRPDGTLVGNGSNELLAAAVRALLPPGGALFSLSPSFSMYPVLARRMGARLATVALRPPDLRPGAEEVVRAASACDLILACSPNNPTGGELDGDVLERLCSLGVPVVWDFAYGEFTSTDPRLLLERHANLAVLRSLSKAWGLAGLRVGALLAADELAARVAAELLPFATGWLVAAAFRAADELRGEGERLVAEVTAERERQLLAISDLPGWRALPSCGNFYLLRHDGRTGRRLRATLAGRGIAVRDIEELDAEGFVRVTVGSREDGDRLLTVMGEVGGDG